MFFLKKVVETFGDVFKNPKGSLWHLFTLCQENTPWDGDSQMPKGLSRIQNPLPVSSRGAKQPFPH